MSGYALALTLSRRERGFTNMTEPRNIILVGFMASGKTSVGRALAKRTGWTLVDADDVIVARAGKPIHRIFSRGRRTGLP